MAAQTATPLPPPSLHTQRIAHVEYEKLDSPGPFPGISSSFADERRVFQAQTPKSTPFDMFSIQHNRGNPQRCRFIRKGDIGRSQALIFFDGSSIDSGDSDLADMVRFPCAGCGIVFGPLEYDYPVRVTLPGEEQTAKRAELFGAISAMRQEPWWEEGFDRVVLATDSRDIFHGVGEVHKWKENGWICSDGSPVENQDLWEALVNELRELERFGTLAQFWLIPREWNEADEYAKEAAYLNGISDCSGLRLDQSIPAHPEVLQYSMPLLGHSNVLN